MNAAFFRSVGGTPLVPHNTADPNLVSWNFGLFPSDLPEHIPTFYVAAPHLEGSWDGKTSVSNWEATRKVLGAFLPAQKQTRGTCVGRGCSGALNVLQCIQIAEGKRADEFRPVSHAWCYGGARTRGGMLGSGDGAMGPDAALWCKEKGSVFQRESGDADYYSDQRAVEWGGSGIPSALLPLAADNPAQEVAVCLSAREAADTIFNGGVVTVASDQGFTMTRDSHGVCQPQGSWAHQMYLAAIVVLPDGRKVFGCGQSWGENTPDGPQLSGCPNYVFGIQWEVADGMLRQKQSMSVGAFVGWSSPGIHWTF